MSASLVAAAGDDHQPNEVDVDAEQQDQEAQLVGWPQTRSPATGIASAALFVLAAVLLTGVALWVAYTSSPTAVKRAFEAVGHAAGTGYHKVVGGAEEVTRSVIFHTPIGTTTTATGRVVSWRTRTTTKLATTSTIEAANTTAATETTTQGVSTTTEAETTTTEDEDKACPDCSWAGIGAHCNKGADDGSRCWRVCCSRTSLPKVLDFEPGYGVENLRWDRCALVGASDILKDAGKGPEIDGHDMVIRVNRIPTEEFWADFGMKTHVLYMAEDAEYHHGDVHLTDETNNVVAKCSDLFNCREAALIFYHNGNRDCPHELIQRTFGGSHAFLGCPTVSLKHMIWRIKAMMNKPATTGFVAFATFASLCGELNVYGFGGRGTADGHEEWSLHPLELEHYEEHQVANHAWDNLGVDMQDWPEDAWMWPWFKEAVKKVTFIGAVVRD